MMRHYKPSDYPMLCEWWNAQNFPPPPGSILPASGYICKEMAAAFLYLTNSPIAWVEWVVADPKAEKKNRNIAIDAIIAFVCEQAKKAGAKTIFTSSNLFPYMKRLERHGFVVGDRKVTQLFKGVA